VAERIFTVEEANALLDQVRPLAEQMIERRRALMAAIARQEQLEQAVKGNGGGIKPEEAGDVADEVETRAAELAECVEAIHRLGAIVKDLDVGLVDFPARRGSEDVLLCWRVGEDEIRYWHGVDAGFAGRKELPL
jgi:hypothetical protein